jgi:hypothetical protein
MSGVFGDMGPGVWALFAVLYGLEAVQDLKRKVEDGIVHSVHDLDAWCRTQKVQDDRWSDITNPSP